MIFSFIFFHFLCCSQSNSIRLSITRIICLHIFDSITFSYHIIFRQPEMRSNFNSLLVVMAILDIGVVVTSIWDYSLVKLFTITPIIYTYIFPYVWYPLKNIIMTWTIFLTMGLSTERYLAVCRPLLYRTLG